MLGCWADWTSKHLDQSKCFDVVPHQTLLDKLDTYGVNTVWFENYLTGHSQQVLIRGADNTVIKSSMKPNSIGVYQGGSLSCILYTIFSNDLGLHANDDVTVVQYADDVQILASGKKHDLPAIVSRIETTFSAMFQWFCHHRMKVNESKTQMLVIGTRPMLRGANDVTVTFNGSQICDSKVVRNLGVMIDRHLTYQAHVDAMTRKCTGVLMALNHSRHAIPSTTLATLVQALVISMLRYCISVYGSCGETQLRRVQKTINFCARVVSGRRRRDHISDVVQRLGWMTARQLVEYHTVSAVTKVVVNGLPEGVYNTIGAPAASSHTHDTRYANRLSVPRIRTEAGRRRLCYRGVVMYNDRLSRRTRV